jgi:hypothetical protein
MIDKDVGVQYANASEARLITPDGYGYGFCEKLLRVIVEPCSDDLGGRMREKRKKEKEKRQTSFNSDWGETKITDMWKETQTLVTYGYALREGR